MLCRSTGHILLVPPCATALDLLDLVGPSTLNRQRSSKMCMLRFLQDAQGVRAQISCSQGCQGLHLQFASPAVHPSFVILRICYNYYHMNHMYLNVLEVSWCQVQWTWMDLVESASLGQAWIHHSHHSHCSTLSTVARPCCCSAMLRVAV